jgi:hypothetical protein
LLLSLGLLGLLMLLMLELLLLVLLRPLQDLRRELTLWTRRAWRTAMHARERWLAVLEVLLGVAVGQALGKTLGRTWILWLLHRRSAPGLVADALSTHHGLDLVQAHQLPGWGSLWSG